MPETPRTPKGILLLLACFGLVGYALRMNISVAAALMMPALGLSKIQLGQLFTGFLIGYTIFQIPWGLTSDRFGARVVLTVAALSWAVCTFLTGFVPGRIFSTALVSFAALWLCRFFLGVGEAAGYPVAARAVGSLIPANRHALAYAAVIAGSNLGAALTPPLISRLMVFAGWRQSFYFTAVLGLLLAAAWHFVSRNHARRHPVPQSAVQPLDRAQAQPHWWRLLSDPAIGLLSLSYFLESYVLYVFVFWSYLYLVEQRHFTFLNGGIYTGLPFLLATFLVPLHGWWSDTLAARYGYGVGRRALAIAGLLLAAIFVLAAVRLNNPYAAVAALSVAVASQMTTENIFWSSSIELGGAYAGTAGGIMNTAGNLGGVVSTALVPVMIQHFGWTVAFGSASALASLSAIAWFFVRTPGKPAAPTAS